MANAKRCDKCGGFYIVNTIYQKISVCIRKEGQSWERMDLCDACYKELLDFFGYNWMIEEVQDADKT